MSSINFGRNEIGVAPVAINLAERNKSDVTRTVFFDVITNRRRLINRRFLINGGTLIDSVSRPRSAVAPHEPPGARSIGYRADVRGRQTVN